MTTFRRLLRRALAAPLNGLLQLAGRAYVAGWTLDDGLRLAAAQRAQGLGCTLGYFSAPLEPIDQVVERSLAVIDAMAALSPPGYASLKAPALGYKPRALAPLLARARERGVRLHFDSHDLAGADATLDCAAQAVGAGVAAGLTLPGRWPRSPDDAERACALGLRVRVVKGEWPDPEAPDHDPAAGFLAVIDALIAHGAAEVAVASHDPPLVREALRRLQAAGRRCELELLNGLPRRAVLAVARERQVPVRVYIPFGIAWRPYALGKALRRPRILLWLLKDLALGLRQRWR